MSRVVYVNGRYVPYRDASVHVEDRGFQFADGVYEVCEVRNGRIIDESRHLARMRRSLKELSISFPMADAALRLVMGETLRRNRVRNGLVYLQVTRGAAKREFTFPDPDAVAPTLVVIARSVDPAIGEAVAQAGIRIVSVPENRWARVDIKTIGLLPNVLAKMAAKTAGAREAWFVDRDGFVTEGGSSNAWIIVGDALVTRHAEHGILRGVTRTTLLDLIAIEGLRFEERQFTIDEAKTAREAFVTSATTILTPVVQIDDTPVGDGKPGDIVLRLRQRFHDIAEWRSL
ncbi:D-amino-acid transaminase [Flaviflagellibacter deserti]|uniref:Probable branched-chain-amino-acid aminotransferase n=1 Tax=Flaviflagellibacter deserti TaxID=2267266 RepID=A0ABV9Z097_9HYPH